MTPLIVLGGLITIGIGVFLLWIITGRQNLDDPLFEAISKEVSNSNISREEATKKILKLEPRTVVSSFGIADAYGTVISSTNLSKDIYKGRVGIVMPVFGRPEYLRRSLRSLRSSNLNNAVLVIVDETGSKLPRKVADETRQIILDSEIPRIPIIKIFKRAHGNMFESFRVGMDLLSVLGVNLFITLDSDTLVSSNWLPTLLSLHNKIKVSPLIVSGFHTDRHATRDLHSSCRIKDTIGGINMLFNKQTYLSHIRPNLISVRWDWDSCRDIVKSKGIIACTRPSVIEHIGEKGLHARKGSHDYSADFGSRKMAL